MMEQKIVISFIIPLYNGGRWIARCIDSILQQHFESGTFEIIVIDDGSTDDSKQIVQNYSCVKYLFQKNQGQSGARNTGLSMARGEYLCFVDQDDAYIPYSLKPCLELALRYKLDMITFNIWECSNKDVGKQYGNHAIEVEEIMTGPVYIEKHEYNNGPWWYMTRREALGNLRFQQGRYGEDGMFTMELLIKVNRIAHIDRCCYYYILHPQCTSKRINRKIMLDYIFTYRYILGLIEKNRDILSDRAVVRCNSRAETYLWYMMIKLLKCPNASNLIDEILEELRKDGMYPVPRPIKSAYPYLKYDIITWVMGHEWLFRLCNKILTIRS